MKDIYFPYNRTEWHSIQLNNLISKAVKKYGKKITVKTKTDWFEHSQVGLSGGALPEGYTHEPF